MHNIETEIFVSKEDLRNQNLYPFLYQTFFMYNEIFYDQIFAESENMRHTNRNVVNHKAYRAKYLNHGFKINQI